MIQISALIYYPIKACRGHAVDVSNVERMGLEHDRRMMVVTPEGRFLTQREHSKLALVTPSISGEKLDSHHSCDRQHHHPHPDIRPDPPGGHLAQQGCTGG